MQEVELFFQYHTLYPLVIQIKVSIRNGRTNEVAFMGTLEGKTIRQKGEQEEQERIQVILEG